MLEDAIDPRPLADVLRQLDAPDLLEILRREKIDNVVVLDRSPAGREGPWITYARMDTLRTPKHLSGPELGLPSLSFRAWYEALAVPGEAMLLCRYHLRKRCYQKISGPGLPKADKKPPLGRVLGALWEGKVDLRGLRIGVMLSGGNVDLEHVPWQR